MTALAKRKGGIIGATVAAFVALCLLMGLGTWQILRMWSKETLIETVNARIHRAPGGFPARAEWRDLDDSSINYVRVRFTATILPGEALLYTAGSSLRPDVKEQGFWVFARAQFADGGIVLINRGFVPDKNKDAATLRPAGATEITGYLRWPEGRGMFTPADDLKANIFFTRDPQAIATARGWTIDAPFYVDQEAPVPPGGLPKPGPIELKLPNNHWSYALTWYGLALTLIGVYGAWLAGRLRKR